jgi:hypothetical protein
MPKYLKEIPARVLFLHAIFRGVWRWGRFVRRPTPHFWIGGLRLGVSGCFLWTSLVTPLVEAHAFQRNLTPHSNQHDEFSSHGEDGGYFSPRSLRDRMEQMTQWIQGQNSRLAWMQGRGDPGSSEQYSDQVRRYSIERFLVQGEMSEELEAKRAQTSRQLAQAGGFHFKQHKDGKREWFKNGKVHRVENEKVMENGREMRRDTLDMTYDGRGNLSGYRTETRDGSGRLLNTGAWEGHYSDGRRRDARLLSFSDKSWDALGNLTQLDRTQIQWTEDGKKTLSYFDSQTDHYGRTTQREVTDSTYDTEGQLTSYKEKSTSSTGETSTRSWSDGKYEKDAQGEWQLLSYKESVIGSGGRQTLREWGQSHYDDKGRLTRFIEKTTDHNGKHSTRAWEKGRYDDEGHLTSYQETIKDEDGRSSFRGWEGGKYDDHGRLVSYQEKTVDTDGVTGWRSWRNGEYNAQNELISFNERTLDAHGEARERVWHGMQYERGLLTHSVESNTDRRGLVSTRDWTGSYDVNDRQSAFQEINTDIAGMKSVRVQERINYDDLGRVLGFQETNTDGYGNISGQTWAAVSFDDQDRVTAYEAHESSTGVEHIRRRTNIMHTASGRLYSYDDEIEVATLPGEGREPPLKTKTHWSDAVYSHEGDLVSYKETTINPLGEVSSHRWTGGYDSLGRTVHYVDERTGAAGPPATVTWKALSFDPFDRVSVTMETVESAGGMQDKRWSGTYDERGLVSTSVENVRAPNGQWTRNSLLSAAYDENGRLKDSLTSLVRSDMPDLISQTKVSGQTYDKTGRMTGGTEVTHLTGRTPNGAIDLTIIGTTGKPSFLDEKLSAFQQTKVYQGTDDRGQSVHIQDVTDVTLGLGGDHTDVTHHMAFDQEGKLVADKTSTVKQTGTVQDAQGRTLASLQKTFDLAQPKIVTTTRVKNTYGATGDMALNVEDSTDAQGVQTLRHYEPLATDAFGRSTSNRTRVTHPGMTVTEEITEQSGVTYDALGRLAGAHEESLTLGTGLASLSTLDRTISYDGSGNVKLTHEKGNRNSALFDTTTLNESFNLSGKVTSYGEKGWSADGGVTDTRRNEIVYNSHGQVNSYKDEGVVGGQYRLNHHTVLDRDIFGREIGSREEGLSENGRYKYETQITAYNGVGQATSRTESGWKASEGNYSLTQTNILYDPSGRQRAYDQTKIGHGLTRESHWESKGVNRQGASLGYRETGVILDGEEGKSQSFTEEQSVAAVNLLGQVLSYVSLRDIVFTDGSSQLIRVHWSNGAYDREGRLDSFFEESATVTTSADGTTKTARSGRERHHSLFYSSDSVSNSADGNALKGFSSGYEETLYTNGDFTNIDRVEVRDIKYDSNALVFSSDTLVGKTNRFKEVMRGVGTLLFGSEGPLSKSARALRKLFDFTEGLFTQVGDWMEAVLAGGRNVLNRLMGLPTEEEGLLISGQLSKETLQTLEKALRKEIGTSENLDLPADLRPAARSFGILDEMPLLTRRAGTIYDANGRAIRWDEYSLSPSAPTKFIQSKVNLTYQANSSRMATYDATTTDGDRVTHTFRDQFVYDAQGRSVYREANFEGDDIKLLNNDQGIEEIPSQDAMVSGVPVGWDTLTISQRTLLLEDIYNGKIEVLGKVDYQFTDFTEFDANGSMENRLGRHEVRGFTLDSLTEVSIFDRPLDQMKEEIATEIQLEFDRQLALAQAGLDLAEMNYNSAATGLEIAQMEYDLALEDRNEASTRKIDAQLLCDTLPGKISKLDKEIQGYSGIILLDDDSQKHGGLTEYRTVWFENSGVIYFKKVRGGNTINFEEIGVLNGDSGQDVITSVSKEGRLTTEGSNFIALLSRRVSLKYAYSKAKAALKLADEDLNGDFNPVTQTGKKGRVQIFKEKGQSLALTQGFFDSANSVWKAAPGLFQTQKNLFSSLAKEQTTLALSALDQTVTSFSIRMAERILRIRGNDYRLDLNQIEDLVNGRTIHLGEKEYGLSDLEKTAMVKRSLNKSESFVGMGLTRPDKAINFTWTGFLELNGRSVTSKDFSEIRTILSSAEHASAQGSPEESFGFSGFSFSANGQFVFTYPHLQTQDGLGRLTSQTSKTYTLSRWNGETSANVVTQTTQAYRYDILGNVVGYNRITLEPGKNSVHERLLSAQFDNQGRQRASATKIEDETGTYTIEMTNEGYDANGRPINTQRVKTQGTILTVSQEIGSLLTDEWGHSLFLVTQNLSTTLADWNKNPKFDSAVGQRGKGYVWNSGFNAAGDVTDSFRMTQKALGPEGSHFVFESNQISYNSAEGGAERSRLSTSVSKVLEMGRDAITGATLFKSYTDENAVTKYSDNGQALLQTTVHHENGVTTTTRDNAVRKYDDFGRLTETSTTTTDAFGLETQNHYKATDFDQAGRATSFERSSRHEGITTFAEKVTGATYSVDGNLLGQTSRISEWDENGEGLKTSTKTETGNTYNLFGQLTKSDTTTIHIDSNGATISDMKETRYEYDLSGRVVKTTVNGQEVSNGEIKPYNSIQEILSWDEFGRAARTRNTSVVDGLTIEKISLQDIQYDEKGRVISGRNLILSTGEGFSKYTEESMDVNSKDFDSWGRAKKYTQTLVNGGLRTTSTINLTYNTDGLASSQITNILEVSVNPGVDHHVERTIKQTGMIYDAQGNLVDYTKEVKEGDLVSTYKPLLMEYDQFGHPTTALERVTDTTGRDDIVGQVGSKYNSLGQLIESPGQSVTLKGTSGALGKSDNLVKVVAGIKAGAFRVDRDKEGKRLVESLGYDGVWVTQTIEPIRYDQQGRANHTYAVTNKVGWGKIDVPVTVTIYDQTVGINEYSQYADALERRKQAMVAQGIDVVSTTFDWSGNTKRNRYCRAKITYNKKVDAVVSTQERSTLDVTVFDALNRPVIQAVTTALGRNDTRNEQFLTYNSYGQVAEINGKVTEKGKNPDGSSLYHTYSQKQTFTYNSLAQSINETTQLWGDSQGPLKITISVIGDIKYGAKGERLSWEDTTSTNESNVTDVRRISGAQYDGLGRLSTYMAVSYERMGGAIKLKYLDRNVVNTYDSKGRLSRSVSRREWGNKLNLTVLSADEAQKAALANDKTGQPGGGVAGLDEGWTSGSAVVSTFYQYGENGSSISGMTVTANGTGTNKNSEVQAKGISLTYQQSNIKYDTTGRAISYHLSTTQVEHYEYFKQVQKGISRKVKSGWKTESVTTDSDVEVLEFDGFGRQIHTVTTSQRNDVNKTWSKTDSVIKSFDEQGRAKDVKRTTDSRMELPKSRGKFAAKFQKSFIGKALKVAIKFPSFAIGNRLSLVMAQVGGFAVMGFEGAMLVGGKDNWLGGQRIYTHNVVEQTMVYRANGQVDEEKTKSQTRTLENDSYMQGKNFGDKAMMAQDIAVAVVAAVISIVFPPMAIVMAAALLVYNSMRQGISTHDLGLFGKNSDRGEQGKKNRQQFWTGVATVVVAWLTAPVKGFQAAKSAQQAINAADTINKTIQFGNSVRETTRAVQAIQTISKVRNTISGFINASKLSRSVWAFSVQMGRTVMAGADKKTFLQVAAIAVLSTVAAYAGAPNTPQDQAQSNLTTQAMWAGSGRFISEAGANFGPEKQRSTWMVVGGAVQSGAGNGSATAISLGQSMALAAYAKKNDASGSTDTERYRRGMVVEAVGGLIGNIYSLGLKLYGDKQIEQKAATLGITPAHYRKLADAQPIPKPTVKSFMIDLAFGLLSPFKALAGFAMALQKTPAADRSIALVAQRETDLQSGLKSGVGELTTVIKLANGARVTCAVDASGQPVFVKGSILEFKNTWMSVENKDYLSGRFVSDGARWQLDGEGLMVANHFKGLSREDGGNLPVTVMGREGAVEPLGVDWTLLPVGMAMKVSNIPTRLNGIGIVYAGTFIHAGDGRAVWEAGSLYQGEGDTRPTMVYSDRGKVSLLNVVEIKGGAFVVEVKNVRLGDGSALDFDNVRISGRIINGVGVITTENVQGTAHLVGQFGEASGIVDVRAGADGFELVGTLKGNVACREREDRAVAADRPNGAGRELPAGQFTVMGKSGGYYHLLGEKIPVTEGGIEPFTANTKFNVAAGAYLRKGPLDYRQNESKGFFKVMSDGTIVAPYKSAVRDFTAHTLSVMGVDGNAESVVRFNNLWQPISGKTAGGMSEGVRPTEQDGKKFWLIEGLGQHDIFVEMTPQERAGNGGAVRGLTTLERYAKKAMGFGLAYVSPVPVSKKSAAVLVESSAHTMTTLAGNSMGLGRNIVILAGIGSDQLGGELLGKYWENKAQDKVMGVFGLVAEKLDAVKISMELINSDRLVGLGGAARDNQLTIGQVGGALAIGSMGDLAVGFVTMSPLGGKSMDYYKKAYSGNAWSVTKAAVKDIVEPIYESLTYASSNGSNPADRGVVAKFYGLGEGEAQPSPMDIYGPEVTMGLAVGNTITVGLMPGALLYGGLKGGVKVFNEEVGVAGNSYGRLSVVQRVGKATVRAGLEVGKEVVVQSADQIVPGVAGKAVHFAERRTTALKVLEFRQIEKNLAISDMAGVNVYDRVGNKVILEIHGRDGQTPNLPELARRMGESTKGTSIEIQIGFSDPAMLETVSGNRDLLNLFDKNGVKNVRDLAKFERGVAVQRRELYERVEKEYKGLAQVKEQAVLKLDGAIADGRVRLAELTELRDNRGRMGDDAFIAKVKSLVGDWDSPGADTGGSGRLGGRETYQRPNSEGLGQPREEIRPGPEGPGGDRKAGESPIDGLSELQKRAEARHGAEQARYGAEQARYGAEQALNSEIIGTENKIRELGQERSGIQNEISVFNGRAERAGAGTRRYGERVQRLDEHLQFLEERLKYLADPAVAKNLKITVTSAWREGSVRTGGFLDGWAQDRKAQPLDATYAPNPYTKIPKGNFLRDFLAEHPDVREVHESRLNQGLSPPESVVLVTVRENLAGAESVVRGIDPWRLKGEGNRFDQAVYFAEEIWTGLLETVGEKGSPSHAAQFDFNVGEARMLDLRNEALAAEFGYTPEKWTGLSQEKVYQKTHEVHHRARMAGYDTIVYESTKNPGHTSYAVIDNFDKILKPSSEPIRPVDPSLLGAARQSLVAVLSDQSGKILVPEKPRGSFFKSLFEKRTTAKPENISPNVSTDGPPIVAPKTEALLSGPKNEPSGPVANPTPRSTPNQLDLKPRAITGFDHLVLENNYKKILPEDFLRLETTFKSPDRIDTTVKDPTTGATNLQVTNPHTGAVITIDGKGNVLRINDPTKTPRAQSPPLNKSNAPRAGPQVKTGNPIANELVSGLQIRAIEVKASALPKDVAVTFEKAEYRAIQLSEELTVYRAEGKAFGSWYGLEKPHSAAHAEKLYNVVDYGNDLMEISSYRIPKGTIVYEGKVAGGDGRQVYLNNSRGAGVVKIRTEGLPQNGF